MTPSTVIVALSGSFVRIQSCQINGEKPGESEWLGGRRINALKENICEYIWPENVKEVYIKGVKGARIGKKKTTDVSEKYLSLKVLLYSL